jgi:hypothetical protein
MSSSRSQNYPQVPSVATANSPLFSTARQVQLPFDRDETPLPGAFNDSELVRGVLMLAIKRSGKSRAQLADEITHLTGRELTEISLNKYTAPSRSDYRWPAELDRAFCYATGDDTLLRCRVELAGYLVITKEEAKLLDLGRQYLVRKRSAETIDMLERSLQGVEI